ncbi:MAG: methyltransferase domain-containing protein [bacterium]|nr:methyltransferase domain-containing protein [bacterium]
MDIRELQEAVEELVFVGAAHKEGVLQELYDKKDTAEGLAGRMDMDKRAVYLLLEALTEMSYLEKKDEIYSVPGDVYERLIDTAGNNYEGDFWQFLVYLVEPWKTLPYVLKHGEPDVNSYKNLSINDFIRGMNSPWKKKLAPEIVSICMRHHSSASVVADIGGAPGTMAREFASRGLRTIIFDLPECAEVMEEELSAVDNIEIVKGDATVSLPQGSYDIAFLGNICHGQSPEDNAKIISMCYEHLNDNGIIVIFDNVRNESYLGSRLALHMLTQSKQGDIFTKDEYFSWITDAGFKDPVAESLSEKAWKLLIARKN